MVQHKEVCVNEVAIAEGWMVATSGTLEGELVRDQVARMNKELIKEVLHTPHGWYHGK